jgi:hypothetical protein
VWVSVSRFGVEDCFVKDKTGLAFATSVKAPIVSLSMFDRERVSCRDLMIGS